MATAVLGDAIVRYKADISNLSSNVKQVKSDMSSVSASVKESSDKVSSSLKKTGEGAKEAGGGFKEKLKHGIEDTRMFTAVYLAQKGVPKTGGQITNVIHVPEDHHVL